MVNHRVRVLLLKDLRLHGRGVALIQAAAVALVWIMLALRPADMGRQVGLLFNVNFLLTGLWGEWLVSREKTKGTFGWLRSLPIADRDLVAAKFAGAALYALVLWAAMSGILAASYFMERPMEWLLRAMALVTFGGVTLAARWRFTQKMGQTLPFALVLVLLLGVAAAQRGGPAPAAAVAFIRSSGGQLAIAVGLLTCYLFTVGATAMWVRRSDTSLLVE